MVPRMLDIHVKVTLPNYKKKILPEKNGIQIHQVCRDLYLEYYALIVK